MKFSRHIVKAIVLASFFCLSACENGVDGGGSIGGGAGSIDSTVVVSGKVSLLGSSSSTTSQKLTTAQKLTAMTSVPQGKPGSRTYMKTRQTVQKTASSGDFLRAASFIDNATVLLYDAEHPEWLYPVSSSTTDSSGNYLLKVLKNSDKNLDAAGNPVYNDGDYIPEGNYTLLAFKPGGFDPILGITTDPIVAVQTVVNTFSGTVSAADLAAQSSTVKPKVDTIIGLKKNTDGTQTWGDASIVVPGNAALPVTFTMAMSRASVLNGVSIEPVVAGEWKVSADWLSAVFYPATALTDGQVYTVTVSGSDTAASSPVTNVYGNALKRSAVATFTAGAVDSGSPTVSILSPAAGTGVSVFDPIRITSDESLDVNSVVLSSTPSLGVKPGVFFVGKNAGNQYVYEFLLANPLAPSTTYDITVSGGTDMSGNLMGSVSHTFTTVAATSITGVDPATDTVTQGIQADVLNVFGRWVRALNDRSIGMLQEMMTGDYVFEYDVGAHGPENHDINRDGRLDLEEFSTMVSEGFSRWDYCETTVAGNPVGNVNVVADVADFQFDLTFSSNKTSQDCGDSPGEMFATVYNINGKWQVGRVSQGIDTRSRVLTTRTVMSGLKLSQNGKVVGSESNGSINGATLFDKPIDWMTGGNKPVTFSWNAVEGATAYVFYIVNARDESRGRAFILPATTTSWKVPVDLMMCNQDYVAVHKLFGFGNEVGNDPTGGMGFIPDLRLDREGEEYYWTVMALDNNVMKDFDAEVKDNMYRLNGPDCKYDPDDRYDVSRASDLFQQISAISHQFRFKNPGFYRELSVSVQDLSAQDITYNEMLGGYDAGAVDQIVLKISTPSLVDPNNPPSLPVGQVNINGHSWNQIQINNFNQVTNPLTGVMTLEATVVVDLFEGWNWIEIWDGVDLYKSFNVQVPINSGIPPVMRVTSIVDQNYNPLPNPDAWGYVNGVDVTSVTITGTIIDPGVRDIDLAGLDADINANINVNLWNDKGISEWQSIPLNIVVDALSGTATFTAELPVYQGNNWINFDAYYCNSPNPAGPASVCTGSYSHMGIYSATGTPWVPPIHDISVITDPTTTPVTLAMMTNDYGNSQNWDASADTNNTVIVTGILENVTGMNPPSYNISSDGEWKSNSLSVNADGSFAIRVELFNGWNYIDVYDAEYNWYGVTVYTSNGKAVIRPKIDAVDGVAYNGSGFMSVNTTAYTAPAACFATVTGQAKANSELQINWSGYDGTNYYYEGLRAFAGPDNGTGYGDYSVNVPLVSGGYNNVDIFDINWRGTFVQLNATTAACVIYSAPNVTLNSVVGNATPVAGGYDAGLNQTVTFTGTSDRPGHNVIVTNWLCSVAETALAVSDSFLTAGSYAWTATVDVYNENNYFNMTDGSGFWGSANITSANNVPAPQFLTVTLAGVGAGVTETTAPGSCNFRSFDAGAATSVTVNGVSNVQNGTGTYWDADGNQQVFTINGGIFSFVLNVYDGSNNISINDENNNYFAIDIWTNNPANVRPKLVEITSHTHNQVVTGPVISMPVRFVVDPVFAPTRLSAYVYDEGAGTSVNYSNDPYDILNFAYSVINPTATPGEFEFLVDVSGTAPVYISVDGYDDVSFMSHGHSIYINNTNNYGQWSYKPGAKIINMSGFKVLEDRANKKNSTDASMRVIRRH